MDTYYKDINVLEYMRSVSNISKCTAKIATISEWNEYWLSQNCSNLKKSTFFAYKNAVNAHINRVLGQLRLTELSKEDVQLFINSLEIGVGIEMPMSPKTIKNVHGVLHKSLEVARSYDYIEKNPADFTILPRYDKPEMHTFTISELNCFMNAISNHPKKVLFTVAIFTGLRQAELIALTWDCVDFDNGSIYIYRQIVKDKEDKGYSFSSLKNSKPRKIYPAPAVMNLLKVHRPKNFRNDDFIFQSSKGKHYTHAAIYNSFKKVVRRIGCPNMRFHDLRHTYAVLSLQAGDDIKTLQSNMGHHSAAFTLNVYGHCQDEMKYESARKMNLFIANNNLIKEL